jgi:hypothetical protein
MEGNGNRFFQEDMDAGIKKGFGRFIMKGRRDGDTDGIDSTD